MDLRMRVERSNVLLTWEGRRLHLTFDLDGADNFQRKLKATAEEAMLNQRIALPSAGRVGVKSRDGIIALAFETPCTSLSIPGDAALELWRAFYSVYKRVEAEHNRPKVAEDAAMLTEELNRLKDRYRTPADRAILNSTLGVVCSAVVGIPSLKELQ